MDDQLRDQFDKAMEMVQLPTVPGGARLERIVNNVAKTRPGDGNFLKEAIGTWRTVVQRLLDDSITKRQTLLEMKAAMEHQKRLYDNLNEQHLQDLLHLKKKCEQLEEANRSLQREDEKAAEENDIDETWAEWTKLHADMDAKFGYLSSSGDGGMGRTEQTTSACDHETNMTATTSSVEPKEDKPTAALVPLLFTSCMKVDPCSHHGLKYSVTSTSIFDFKENKWKGVSLSLPYQQRLYGSAFVNGEVYILGGVDDEDNLSSYKLNRKLEWERLPDMNEARYGISNSCVVFDGQIWLVGGYSKGGTLKTVVAYDPPSNSWIKKPHMRVSREDAAAAVLRGKIFVCGGYSECNYLDTVEYFDPRLDKWSFCASMPAPRSRLAAVAQGSFLTVLSGTGSTNNHIANVWRINVEDPEPKWSMMPSMKYGRKHCCASMVDGKIVVAGSYGIDDDALESVEVFDGKEWINGPSMEGVDDQITTTLVSLEFAQALLAYNPHDVPATPAGTATVPGTPTTSSTVQ